LGFWGSNGEHTAVDQPSEQPAEAQTNLSAIGLRAADIAGQKRDAVPDKMPDNEQDAPAAKKARMESNLTDADASANVAVESDSQQPVDGSQLPGSEEQAVTAPAAQQSTPGSSTTDTAAEQPKLLPSTSPKTSSVPTAAAATAATATRLCLAFW